MTTRFTTFPLLLFVVAPLVLHGEELLPPDRPIEQVIDFYVDRQLEAAGITPAPAADDANLLRRTMLDLVGRIPTATEAKGHLADEVPDRRQRLIDRLMDSPGFARHQATEFDILLMQGTRGSVHDYLLQAFRDRRPWNEMFRDLMLGTADDPNQQGAIQFVKRRCDDLDKLTNDASVIFFGINVSCAQCHDHPLVADWSQHHFYGMKSFFSRTFNNGDFVAERAYGRVSFKTSKGEEHPAQLMFLDGTLIDEPDIAEPSEADRKAERERLEELKKNKRPPPVPAFSRRAQLVEVAMRPNESAYFSRAIVNRLWARLIGRGLVDPVDQMHPENPPSHPQLLAWLARDLFEHGYDLRRLMRGIVSSQVYARSSRWNGEGRPADELFAVASVRPLRPHQYAMLLRMGSTNPDRFASLTDPAQFDVVMEQCEQNARPLVEHFEQPDVDFQVSITEALYLSNNPRIEQELLAANAESLVGKLESLTSAEEIVLTAFWNICSRPPDDEELKVLTPLVAKPDPAKGVACRQLVWALLTSSESRFNY